MVPTVACSDKLMRQRAGDQRLRPWSRVEEGVAVDPGEAVEEDEGGLPLWGEGCQEERFNYLWRYSIVSSIFSHAHIL